MLPSSAEKPSAKHSPRYGGDADPCAIASARASGIAIDFPGRRHFERLAEIHQADAVADVFHD